VFGIAVTFVLNLGVSFSIAASLALKAYGVSGRDQLRFMRYTLVSFLRSPRRFLIPSAEDWHREAIEGDAVRETRQRTLSP
jgi:site-specific recombinase